MLSLEKKYEACHEIGNTSVLLTGTGPVFWSCFCLVHFSVHFLHHHMQELEKGDPTDQVHCQQGTSSKKKAIAKRRPVRTLARVDRAAVWAENFVGGKFRDITKIVKFSTPRKQPAIQYC